MLTVSQNTVMQDILQALKEGEKRIVLEGSAGTGKTFLLKTLVDEVIKIYCSNKWDEGGVYITAPTNKALAILKSKIDPGISKVFKTTHAALKLKRKVNPKTGIQTFEPEWNIHKEPPFSGCVLAIIDESSMLATTLLDMLNDFSFPIIFVGDNKQLNPVKEANSPVFIQEHQTFSLTEIVRQGAGNPIIELSRDLDMIWFKEPKIIEGKGYIYSNNKDLIIKNLAEANGTDELKYLAWTNDDVNSINPEVRRLIYGNPGRIEKGETMVFNSPYGDHWTNEEMKVESLEIRDWYISVPTRKTQYDRGGIPMTGELDKLKIKVYNINEGNVIVPHEETDEQLKNIKQTLANNCSIFKWNWKAFYYFSEQFGDLTYNHAITVHKSQGSTYKEAIVNVGNIDRNNNSNEKRRMLYTAITRASDKLILYNLK